MRFCSKFCVVPFKNEIPAAADACVPGNPRPATPADFEAASQLMQDQAIVPATPEGVRTKCSEYPIGLVYVRYTSVVARLSR